MPRRCREQKSIRQGCTTQEYAAPECTAHEKWRSENRYATECLIR